MSVTPDALAAYFEARNQERQADVTATLGAMNPRERRLVREAAVMGYVQGVQACGAIDHQIPKDSAILARVVDACLAIPDLYPVMNRLLRLATRRART